MRKEGIIKIVEIIQSAGHEVISFNEINSLPIENPLAPYGIIVELKTMFYGKSKENMVNLIEGFHSIGYEILVLDRALPYPEAILKITPVRN